MIQRELNVIYLTRNDVVKRPKPDSFVDINIHNFNLETLQLYYKADLVIFVENGEYKVLKSRY